MLEVRIRPRAQLDIESIYIHIAVALGAPMAADETAEAIYRAIDLVAHTPGIGAPFESDRLSRTYRRMLAKNYWIYYSADDDCLTVWRIFHTRQDTPDSTLIEF